MELRLYGQEKTYKLKLKFLKTKHKQRQLLLQQLIETKQINNNNDIKREKQKISDIYSIEKIQIERERWSLNARSYYELKRFKKFKHDLEQYHLNLTTKKGLNTLQIHEYYQQLFHKNNNNTGGSSNSVLNRPSVEGSGIGVHATHEVQANDNEFDQYRKRMMLAYRFRPNPLNNPRRDYY